MTLPVSTKDVIRFQPEEGGPVYLLAVPSYLQRAAFRRDVRAAGATYPGDKDLLKALREDLAAVNPANLEDLLALVDEAEAATAGEVDPETVDRLADLARLARAIGGRYAALEGDREFWLAVAPLVACRHFLIGWDGRAETFVRHHGLTTDETLGLLSDADLLAIGFRAMALMQPSKDQEKNSASPSPSRLAPPPSPTDSTSSPATTDGNSSVSATEATQPAA